MNCLFLVLLLLCCGNDGGNGCGCSGGRNMVEREGRRGGQGRDRDCDRDRNDGCGCNDRDRNNGNVRRNDDGPESRFESRGFIPYPGSSCGNEEPENHGGCNCAD